MSEVLGWFEWFNLRNDPFSTSPITSASQEKLFYKTSDIQNKIDPVIRRLNVSDPFIKLIIGERGLGKTTALYYMEKEAQNFDFLIPIPIEISFRNPNNVSPEIFIGEDILFQFIHKVLSYIYPHKNDTWVHYNEFFNKTMKNCGFEIFNNEIFPDPSVFPNFPTLRMTAQNILRLCESEKYRLILLIDQIDKDPIDYALKFLKSSHSQTLLEMFTRSGSMVFISGKTDLYRKMFTGDRIGEDFSYLSDVIMLEPLKQTEVIELLNCRFNSEANENFQNPLDIEVIHNITVAEKGTTRYIITKIKETLQKAHKLREKKVTITLYNSSRFKHRDYSDIYYRLVVEDGTCKIASERLIKLYVTLDKGISSYKDCLNLLRKIHTKKRLFKTEEFFISRLQDQGLLLRNEKREQIVAPEIGIFFGKLEEKGITLEDFIGWFTDSKVEEISLAEQNVEPDRVLDIFNILIKKIASEDLNIVTNINQDGSKIEFTRDILQRKIIDRIKASKQNYTELRNIDWEEIPNEVYQRLNEILFTYLQALVFFSASYFNENLSFKDKRGMWSNIHHFVLDKAVPEFGVYIGTWNNLKELRRQREEILVDKSRSPESNELLKSYDQIESIIIEIFDKIWSAMLNIPTEKRTQKSESGENKGWKILHEESIGVGQRPKAERIIKEWLEQANGDVSCWLNYIDETTISYLNNMPRTCKIRIITSEIQENSKFMKEAAKLGKVCPKFEVRMVRVDSESTSDEPGRFSERNRAIIHKRRLISNNIMIDFGTDLKSAALGNTKHNMALMESDPSNKEEFDMEWNRNDAEWTRIEGIPIKVTHYEWPTK